MSLGQPCSNVGLQLATHVGGKETARNVVLAFQQRIDLLAVAVVGTATTTGVVVRHDALARALAHKQKQDSRRHAEERRRIAYVKAGHSDRQTALHHTVAHACKDGVPILVAEMGQIGHDDQPSP